MQATIKSLSEMDEINNPLEEPKSKALENAPQLSAGGLTKLLVVMCIVPVVTIAALFWYMPPVFEGKLEAAIEVEGLPPASFYASHVSDRSSVNPEAVLIIKNVSEQDWTHLNIQVNKFYQIYDHDPIPAGSERRYRFDRFVSRTGAKFSLKYNPFKDVRIYARRPTKDRATFATDFDWESIR